MTLEECRCRICSNNFIPIRKIAQLVRRRVLMAKKKKRGVSNRKSEHYLSCTRNIILIVSSPPAR